MKNGTGKQDAEPCPDCALPVIECLEGRKREKRFRVDAEPVVGARILVEEQDGEIVAFILGPYAPHALFARQDRYEVHACPAGDV